MEYQTSDVPPPIPARVHRHGRPRPLLISSNSNRHINVPPASPEVISNLITSLSAISQPASSHFEGQTSLSLPASPGHAPGSFGVDYGAYHPSLQDLRQEPISLDDLAACPPTIRTSKPPSGYSPITANKTTKSPSRESSGLRSFIRSSTSRPSSKGSSANNDDAQSIGNLSIERRSAPEIELNHQRSHDSWGKKTSRSQKGLMYMSSKEQLREREAKRSSGGLTQSSSGGLGGGSSVHSGGRGDPFLAETAIHEEPVSHTDPAIDRSLTSPPRPIPNRDSSLRSRSHSQKRSSARRAKRDSNGPSAEPIPETEEHKSRGTTTRKKRPEKLRTTHHSYVLDEPPSPSRTKSLAGRSFLDVDDDTSPDGMEDEGAPFPAVAQGRRRSEQSNERVGRRRSGRQSPAPVDDVKIKRSSSRLKRLSGPLGPKGDEKREFQPLEPNTSSVNYDRPQSADSIDDAVDSYLCSPRLSQKIKHPQTGRVISFSEVGDSEGSAVFCCVGMGLTRYITAFYDELALTLKLRLITPDRPGVGDSEPYTDGTATPLSWPDDVYAICQALKITKFSILAHSAGAIYALATALRMPQHIRGRIHLLAPWIPPSQMNVFGTSQTLPPTNAIPTSQRILRALPTPILKAANSSFMTATSSSITSSLPKNPRRTKRKSNTHGRESNRNVTPSLDKENIGNEFYAKSPTAATHGAMPLERPNASENMDRSPPLPGMKPTDAAIIDAAADAMADKERQMTYDIRLTHAIWELATTGANPAVDLLVCLERRHTIGFRYVDITRPVVIHHGSRDTRVPVDNVKWLGKTMRRCEVRVLEGEGHGLMASASVMGSVLMEMSKEWEDWMKVTGSDGRRDRSRGRRSAR